MRSVAFAVVKRVEDQVTFHIGDGLPDKSQVAGRGGGACCIKGQRQWGPAFTATVPPD
ncbi:DUF3304 domain-containing protein [Microvirga brassicacearum]|uniref:DUF3304 domain-containing protein n=1 Tax=Microvirga brassicacearum TaxID=2580413 RepID=A0A5N3PDH7_9HYPH|nr:DUF3304 domain-containing protein [Microvirga brassicacearum]